LKQVNQKAEMIWRSVIGVAFIVSVAIFSCSETPAKVDCTLSNLTLEVVGIKYADCGLSNGQITVEATGGNNPYRFTLDQGQAQPSPIFLDVRPGFHSVQVVDADGCSASASTFMGSKEPFPVNTATTPSGCGGSAGTISVFPLGGVPPYKYQLGENNDNYQVSNVWENLRSGTHSIWVEDVNKCFFGVYVFVPSGISYSESVKPIIENSCAVTSCHDGAQEPDLRTFANIKSNASKIKSMVVNRTMPPISQLSSEAIQLIACWVDDGAPNN
jgi:hypothetical protein